MSAIHDPLGQSHSPASCDHYSQLKLFVSEVLKSGDGQTDGRKLRTKIVTTMAVTMGRPRGSIETLNWRDFANIEFLPVFVFTE